MFETKSVISTARQTFQTPTSTVINDMVIINDRVTINHRVIINDRVTMYPGVFMPVAPSVVFCFLHDQTRFSPNSSVLTFFHVNKKGVVKWFSVDTSVCSLRILVQLYKGKKTEVPFKLPEVISPHLGRSEECFSRWKTARVRENSNFLLPKHIFCNYIFFK